MTHHPQSIVINVIIPVHNAEKTIKEAVRSAMEQSIPEHLVDTLTNNYKLNVNVCCYNDGSEDNSLAILTSLKETYANQEATIKNETKTNTIPSKLWIGSSPDGCKGRGAGYARNRAVELVPFDDDQRISHFLCLLDSDDMMHPHRVAEQTNYMMNSLTLEEQSWTLLGSTFERDPPDSTWHYSKWANTLSQDRLMLERFREVTILQPTWFMCRSRWEMLGGYVEAPLSGTAKDLLESEHKLERDRLIHKLYDDLSTLRLAEDLRFFHEHLASDGILRRVDTKMPLVTYRHNGESQSYRTSRKLLQQLRVLAFERSILDLDPLWQEHKGKFVVWSAGRDGKEFVKTLRADLRKRVYCFVDLDSKKLESGNYWNRELDLNIPIVHYSYLAKDSAIRTRLQKEWKEGMDTNSGTIGCIDKSNGSKAQEKRESQPPRKPKRRRLLQIPTLESSGLSASLLQELPVVVCVAMYRTNGVLEANVKSIGRTEGKDLWHFC